MALGEDGRTGCHAMCHVGMDLKSESGFVIIQNHRMEENHVQEPMKEQMKI